MQLIDTPEALEDARKLLERAPWAAVDTEADSLHHYIEKLCLVQVSIPGHDFVVDPLVPGIDLKPFAQTLVSRPILLHGADFDIRMIKRATGLVPQKGIFDTVIAAQLLGYERQGLADLVEKHFQIKLSKSSQKADWSRRPLNDVLLDYAVNDTKHLKELSEILTRELKELGRLEWHRQFCERLLRSLAATKEEDRAVSETAWQLKGSKELKGKGLTALKALWQWREAEAMKKDRPTFKVMHSELLVQIAGWSSTNPGKDVAEFPNAPRHVRGEHRDALNRVLGEALHHPELRYAHKPREHAPRRWTEKQNQELTRLKGERERLGKELKIQPSLLATNAVLENIVYDPPKNEEELKALESLLPWQAEILAPVLLPPISN